MRAGLLREKLEFLELMKVTSPSGAVNKEYVYSFSAMGHKRKLSLVVNAEGVNASEEFIGNIIIFQVRYNPKIKDTQRVIYQGQEYTIQLLNRQLKDNTLQITLKKVNV